MVRFSRSVTAALLELMFPERCLLCGAAAGDVSWCPTGPRVDGLRIIDRPHLCSACYSGLAGAAQMRSLRDENADVLPVAAGMPTHESLVNLLRAFKYHGVRGLAWPLGRLLVHAVREATAIHGHVSCLTAVPLHRTRQRERGFNQAEMLARIVSQQLGIRYRAGIVGRKRRTEQQAKIPAADGMRGENVAGAFEALSPAPEETGSVALIDDLITSGATIRAVWSALRDTGWRVVWVAALGVSIRSNCAEADLDSLPATS